MAREGLTGSRIRERRVISGLKQADLARHVGISASYLNLIEHNRRRIGGKLLLDIARVLSVEPAALTEGAEAALIATLRDAAAKAGLAAAEA
ncbi:MAG: helix-turn-helix transcriptional regulator, partial [Pseudomonadota bacterium]